MRKCGIAVAATQHARCNFSFLPFFSNAEARQTLPRQSRLLSVVCHMAVPGAGAPLSWSVSSCSWVDLPPEFRFVFRHSRDRRSAPCSSPLTIRVIKIRMHHGWRRIARARGSAHRESAGAVLAREGERNMARHRDDRIRLVLFGRGLNESLFSN